MDMKDLTVREYRKDELKLGLGVRNSIFPPISEEIWELGQPQTAAIAFCGNEAIGFIPFSLRNFKLAPGISITAAFEHGVGVKQNFRGQGIGTLMIKEASAFLKGRADGLFVYRDDERSKGYDFYSKTHHFDMVYMRKYICNKPQGSIRDSVVVSSGADELIKNSGELLEIFEETYGQTGGFPVREKDYWCKNIKRRARGAIPVKFYLFKFIEGSATAAYLIAGARVDEGPAASGRRLEILEMAARRCDEDKIKKLLEAVGDFSQKEGFSSIGIMTGDQNPFIQLLPQLGFEPGTRCMQIMALCLDVKALFDRTWGKGLDIPGIELRVRTPVQDLVLYRHKGSIHKNVVLEMKEETLTRWIFGRVDLKSRICEGSVTAINGDDKIVDVLSRSVRLVNWVYHHIDFI